MLVVLLQQPVRDHVRSYEIMQLPLHIPIHSAHHGFGRFLAYVSPMRLSHCQNALKTMCSTPTFFVLGKARLLTPPTATKAMPGGQHRGNLIVH